MDKANIAKLFQHGRSQSVRLPREFHFAGDRVRIRRVPQGVLLEQTIQDPAVWFRKLDEFSEPFMLEIRQQAATPKRRTKIQP